MARFPSTENVVNDLGPKDRDVAMVFQSYALDSNMNACDSIRVPLEVRGVDPAAHDEMVRRASSMVELDDFLHRRPAELSGGQRQRVALARATVREPNLFLMDGPLSGLDAELRVSILAQIKSLSQELKVTGICVTHDQIEAMTPADRAVAMAAGVVQQVGTPAGTHDKPANAFVTGFIGSPAMNLVEGRIAGGIFKAGHIKIEGLSATDGPTARDFRAEDVGPGGEGHDESKAPTCAIELLGDATMVTVRRRRAGLGQGPQGLPRRNRRPGQPECPRRNCHLFDAGTGARVEA